MDGEIKMVGGGGGTQPGTRLDKETFLLNMQISMRRK